MSVYPRSERPRIGLGSGNGCVDYEALDSSKKMEKTHRHLFGESVPLSELLQSPDSFLTKQTVNVRGYLMHPTREFRFFRVSPIQAQDTPSYLQLDDRSLEKPKLKDVSDGSVVFTWGKVKKIAAEYVLGVRGFHVDHFPTQDKF